MSFWRPTLEQIGPTRLGVWMLRLRMGWLARPFGIGMHSDAQLKVWACQREQYNGQAFHAAVYALHKYDRLLAGRLRDTWPGVTK